MNLLFNNFQVYDTRYFLYTYNSNDFRIVKMKNCRKSGFEEIKKTDTFDYNSEEVQRCSLSRTKRMIKELALCNDFEYFSTLTINSDMADRFSLDNCQQLLKKLLKKIKRKNKNFRYIFITEKHENGAFHFHGLIGGINKEDFVLNDNGYYHLPIFTDNLGFNSFSPIVDYSKCCNYITKYITKDCVKNSHNQVYISSRGLKKATREEFKHIDFVPSFSNDYCDILDFRLSDLSANEINKIIFDLKEGKKISL